MVLFYLSFSIYNRYASGNTILFIILLGQNDTSFNVNILTYFSPGVMNVVYTV